MDETMVCRLLAQMNKMWPEEAAAAKPDLRLVHPSPVKEMTDIERYWNRPDRYNPREFRRKYG